MMNSTVTADLPRRVSPPVGHALPASQRCIGLLNGEASYPGKGCASDITGYYMAFLMADGTVRMAGSNNNNDLAMEGTTPTTPSISTTWSGTTAPTPTIRSPGGPAMWSAPTAPSPC